VGDPRETVRLPSLLFGTATVPLVYLLGARTVGRAAGVVGAAVVALAPFAIFYGIEARAYATLAFLCAASTLLLLRALDRGDVPAWIAYVAVTAAVLYTHYTGLFLVLGQLGWALATHRDRTRPILLAHGAVALAYLPWLPSLLDQLGRSSIQTEQFAEHFPLSFRTLEELVAHVLPGYPFVPLADLPGTALAGVFWCAIAAGLAVLVVSAIRPRRAQLPRTVWLVVVLSVVTPAGLILYSAQPDKSLLVSRNLSASLPCFALLVGWLLTRLPRQFAIAACASVLGVLAFGASKTLTDDFRRPPYRDIALRLDRVAAPEDPVLTDEPLYLRLYFERPHRVLPASGGPLPAASSGASVYLVRPQVGFTVGLPALLGPESRIPLREGKRFRGSFPIEVGRYAGRVSGRLARHAGHPAITWSFGRNVPISAGAARGAIDDVARSGRVLTVTGWATNGPRPARPADWVLAFEEGHLVATAVPRNIRVDVAKAYGESAIVSGFTLTFPLPKSDRTGAEVRVYALEGKRGSLIERAHTH
jgi:hypothetical protein